MLRRYLGHSLAVLASLTVCFLSATAEASGRCARIADGTIVGSDGEPLTLGFDEWGYNYNAHLFFGFYCDALHDAESCQAYRDVRLIMKWNDAWLSKRDCDGDNLLDRHHGSESYRGSGAWISNLMQGTYEFESQTCSYLYYTHIEAVPEDAELVDGVWFDADGEEIGPEVWGDFAVTKEKLFDPCGEAGSLALPQ